MESGLRWMAAAGTITTLRLVSSNKTRVHELIGEKRIVFIREAALNRTVPVV